MIRWCISLVASLGLAHLASAQANDGFQRRDGAMYVLRNGETKPMTRDARLPNGRLVTRDGFVVLPNGQRLELRDGQGCTLLGEPVSAATQASGRTVLATSAGAAGPRPAQSFYQVSAARWSPGYGRGKGKGKGKKRKHKHDDD